MEALDVGMEAALELGRGPLAKQQIVCSAIGPLPEPRRESTLQTQLVEMQKVYTPPAFYL